MARRSRTPSANNNSSNSKTASKGTPKPAAKALKGAPAEGEEGFDPRTIEVRLKPIWGIDPAVYVPIVWAALIIGTLVWALFMPGSRGPGARIYVSSDPAGSVAYIDDRRLGVTPLTTFVAAGEYRLTVRSALGEQAEQVVTVGSRLIGNRIYARREHFHLTLPMPAGFVDNQNAQDFLSRYAAWSLAGRPSAQFQSPWSASELAALSAGSSATHGEPARVLREFAAHATGRIQNADLLRAAFAYATSTGAPTPAALGDVVRFFIQLDNNSYAFDRFVSAATAAVAADESGVGTLGSALDGWRTGAQQARDTELLTVALELDEGMRPATGVRSIGGVQFVRVGGGTYLTDYPLRDPAVVGVPVTIDDLWLQQRPVTRAQYARFVAAQPQWAPDQRETLTANGLADWEYLTDWDQIEWRATVSALRAGSTPSAGVWWTQPVTQVSWHAAMAFAQWFSGAAGVDARLPSATEWEYAAFLNDGLNEGAGGAGLLGAVDLVGGNWEWTADWYAANRYLLDGNAPYGGDHRVVAGGTSRGSESSHRAKGSIPPEWSPSSTTFRIVVPADAP